MAVAHSKDVMTARNYYLPVTNLQMFAEGGGLIPLLVQEGLGVVACNPPI
jgi:hypothetical protein